MVTPTFDPVALYGAVIGTVGTVLSAFQLWRQRRRLSVEASTYPVLSGDFPGDLSPELEWQTLITVRNSP
jgi:hypothetical protein